MCRKWQSGVLLGIMQECGYFSSNLFVPEEVVQEEKVSSIVGFDILQEEAAMGVGIDIIVHGKEYVFAGALGRASLFTAVALGRRVHWQQAALRRFGALQRYACSSGGLRRLGNSGVQLLSALPWCCVSPTCGDKSHCARVNDM